MKRIIFPAAILIEGVSSSFAAKADETALVNEDGTYFHNSFFNKGFYSVFIN
ncbi:MAG: hypothetical protein MUW56_20665 [Chryseobacterium sp.]|uniref:hypothetical protein n=1 Tax=Chryseobacterium sp. TaxID=1871047 RepID=UPI0025C38BFE|nr:hypothetical protein [Chryseobacterium sp.]MCJ7935971.1 hypothetical protein [Chryseobacterium sp.]